MDLTNRVCIVTGASAGIGEATAIEFGKLGAKVVLVGRNLDNLEKAKEKTLSAGAPAALVIQADLSLDEELDRIIPQTVAEFGELHVLVNNAGILVTSCSLADYDDKTFEQVIKVNLQSCMRLTAQAIPYLELTKGNVVNVSSVGGHRSFPGEGIYGISKAGMDQYTRCLALDLGPRGIRVNVVSPGCVDTSIFAKAGLTGKALQDFYEESKSSHVIGRIGQPKEIALAIAFLASDAASFITGTLLPVDGGKHIMTPF